MNQAILITGGFGYLGGRIALAIANETSCQVRLASRKPCTAPPWLPQAQTVVMDVLDTESLRASLRGVKAVVHLAAVNENESAVNPEKALRVNTLGTLRLLQAAIAAGVERFIYFSTAHIYGAPLEGYISEQVVSRPVHPYAITHRAAEDFVLAAHDERRIRGYVIRLSNGFGAPAYAGVDRWTLLVNDLCRQAVQTRQLVLRSAGLQQRDFITLHDVGRAVCHLLALSRDAGGDGLFNLGGELSMSVWDMAQRIANCCRETLGFDPKIERPVPAPGEEAPSLVYDISKFKQTGFVLEGDIDIEIKQTLRLCESAWQDDASKHPLAT
ncbi:MAG: SDR family oxidoreductase [Proteobacteria bacterium]|nr:SDR family oxidoreductase [Pseudomonadota bacterium]